MGEQLKQLDDVMKPDPRWRYFRHRNGVTGDREYQPAELHDLHRMATDIKLNPSVPEGVRNQFVTAQHLCVYSWFCYALNTPAMLWAAVTVEHALRERFTDAGTKATFSDLLRRAAREGLLTERESIQCDGMRGLRNSMAHGSPFLVNAGLWAIDFAAGIINRLWPEPTPQGMSTNPPPHPAAADG